MDARDRICRLSTRALEEMLQETQDDETLEAIHDELEARQLDLDAMDWTEQDYRSAQEERIELWRREQ